jgi:RsmE family RNA methyltransferase
MNIVLFTAAELHTPLPLHDRRAEHVLKVLKCRTGESFDAGLIEGPRGKARLLACTDRGLDLEFAWEQTVPELYPAELVVGLARPQTVRKILTEVTSLGVQAINFICTEKSEKSYQASRLWSQAEYKSYVQAGVEQAFCTRFPEIRLFDSVTSYVKSLRTTDVARFVLDNYEASVALKDVRCRSRTGILAIGAERGWSANERHLWREHDFTLVSLGKRVLRTETACVAGLALLLAGLGYL